MPFRPFFLLAAAHAVATVALWVPAVAGLAPLPGAMAPPHWHAHELLFGYVPAVQAGVLLTAIAHRAGRPPVAGAPLAALLALWLAGRLAMALAPSLSPALAGLTLLFPVAAILVVGREMVAAGRRGDAMMLAAPVLLALAQLEFHRDLMAGGAGALGERLAVAAVAGQVLVVAGKLVPAFAEEWLRQAGRPSVVAVSGWRDRAALAAAGAALIGWIVVPAFDAGQPAAGALLLGAGLVAVVRQAHWGPLAALRQPHVAALHASHGFAALGLMAAGLGALEDLSPWRAAALHLWTIGGLGIASLAIMTRASLGHTGRPIAAGAGTILLFCALAAAALARAAGVVVPESAAVAVPVAGLGWIGAFAGFLAIYGPILLSPDPQRREPAALAGSARAARSRAAT